MTATKRSPRLFQGFLSPSSPAPPASSRAHAFTPSPLDDLPLSSCLGRSHAAFPVSLHLGARVAPRAPLGGPRGVPGVVSSSHPLFHPRTAPARPGDVPLAHPPACSPSASLTIPSCGCPLGLSSVHTTLLRPHSPLIMLLRQRWPSLSPVTRFSSLSLFSISTARLFYRPSSSSRALACYLTGPYPFFAYTKLPFRRTPSFLAGHLRRIEFECVRDAKAGHGFVSLRKKCNGQSSRMKTVFVDLILPYRNPENKTK